MLAFVNRLCCRADQLDLNDEHILSVLDWASTRIKSLHQLVTGDLLFLWVLPKKGGKNELEAGMLKENDVNYTFCVK